MFKLNVVNAMFLGVVSVAVILNPIALLINIVCLTAVYFSKLNIYGTIAALACSFGVTAAAMVACYGWQLTISLWTLAAIVDYWRARAHA